MYGGTLSGYSTDGSQKKYDQPNSESKVRYGSHVINKVSWILNILDKKDRWGLKK